MSKSVESLMKVVTEAAALRAEGKLYEAQACLTRTIDTLPTSHVGMSKSLFNELRFPMSSLRAARSYCRVKLGSLDGALEDAAAALQFAPEDTSIKLLAAHVHYVAGDVKSAAKLASEVVADCGEDMEDYDLLGKRASRLLRRCAIDRAYDINAPSTALGEADSYANDEEFDSAWEPLALHCNNCGKPFASSSNHIGIGDVVTDGPVAMQDLHQEFSKRMAHERLIPVAQGSLGHRFRVHLPAVYGAVVALHCRQLVDESAVAEVLFYQLVACCPEQKSNLQVLVSCLFGESSSSPKRLIFCTPQSDRLVSSMVTSKISQYLSTSCKTRTVSGPVEKLIASYSALNSLLVERCVGGVSGMTASQVGSHQFSRGIASFMKDVSDDVYEKPMLQLKRQQHQRPLERPLDQRPTLAPDQSSVCLWKPTVAAGIAPLCGALFVKHCGEAVQGLFSSQQRRRDLPSNSGTPAAPDVERSDDDSGSAHPLLAENADAALQNTYDASQKEGNMFQFPAVGSSCGAAAPFAHALAPLLRQYYLKRSSSEAQQFARELLNLCAPKEIHGQLRALLTDYLNTPM